MTFCRGYGQWHRTRFRRQSQWSLMKQCLSNYVLRQSVAQYAWVNFCHVNAHLFSLCSYYSPFVHIWYSARKNVIRPKSLPFQWGRKLLQFPLMLMPQMGPFAPAPQMARRQWAVYQSSLWHHCVGLQTRMGKFCECWLVRWTEWTWTSLTSPTALCTSAAVPPQSTSPN